MYSVNRSWISIIVFILIFTVLQYSKAADVATSATVTNSLPVASSALLNGGADITLVANQSVTIQGSVTITDANGCAQIENVTSTLFRTNVTGGDGAADNNRSHYSTLCTSNADCAGGPDTTETFTCDFDVAWYADPTDVGSLYNNTNWTFNTTPTDGAGGVSDYDQQILNTLSALAVETGSIAFGTLSLGANTGAVNQNSSLSNHGNEPVDINIKGYGAVEGDGFSMICSSGDLNVDYVQYDTAAFVYGVGQDLQDFDVEVDIDLDRGNETMPKPSDLLYYGLGFPGAGISGNCTGTIVIVAVSDPFLD